GGAARGPGRRGRSRPGDPCDVRPATRLAAAPGVRRGGGAAARWRALGGGLLPALRGLANTGGATRAGRRAVAALRALRRRLAVPARPLRLLRQRRPPQAGLPGAGG